ncbi:hypothetical protein [uncultured Dysosmobacter sp.]|uniref:hypothetical protein n=1 Tax=uncultured Dysosmobacter sp. TaxID=2591384 RepID=UPI00260AFD81|nr:hypothetical protein [uncultured Dysosmobacter sp.]
MNGLLLIAVLLIAWLGLACYFWQRERGPKAAYDERQEQARGLAYKYGFLTLAVCVCLLDTVLTLFPWIGTEAGGFFCLDLGVTVFAVTAIWKDAYLRLYEKPWEVVTMWGLCGLGGLLYGVFSLRKEGLLVDGMLNLSAVLIVISGSVLLTLAVFLYRRRAAGREDEEP